MLAAKHLNFVSSLYRYAPSRPVTPFRRWALSQLSRIVNFDAAIWSNVTEQSSTPHLITASGLISDQTQLSELLKSLQTNFKEALSVGVGARESTLRFASTRSLTATIRDRLRQLHVDAILPSGAVVVTAGSGDASASSQLLVLREHTPFSNEEVETLAHLAFYMSDSSSLACFLHLRQPKLVDRNRRAALTSHAGELLEAQPLFVETLRDALPSWEGGILPFVVGAPFYTQCEVGPNHRFSVEPFDDLLLVRVWARSLLDRLTQRETQCVIGVCRGQTYKQIARDLGISASTVGTLIHRAMEKLEVDSRLSLRELVIRISDDVRRKVLGDTR